MQLETNIEQEYQQLLTTSFVHSCFVRLVVREQTTTDVNISFAELHSCAYMRVCSVFFLFFCISNYIIYKPNQQHNKLNLTPTVVAFVRFVFGRARIDNNRREYFIHRAAQLCIHACVLRFFLFLSLLYNNSYSNNLLLTLTLPQY